MVFLAFWSFSEVNLTFTSHVVAWSSRGWSPWGVGTFGSSSIFQHGKPHSSIRDSLIFKKFQNIRISKNVRFSEFFWISEFFSDFQNISDFQIFRFSEISNFQKLPDFQFCRSVSEVFSFG